MENKRELGSFMEEEAALYLENRGVKIIERNYRFHRNEIDIIGYDGEYYIFTEVKYRSGNNSGRPEEAVDYKKQKTIRKVALAFLVSHKLSEYTPVRFDVIAIDKEIRWYKNAF